LVKESDRTEAGIDDLLGDLAAASRIIEDLVNRLKD
jgi:hypothetical protein